MSYESYKDLLNHIGYEVGKAKSYQEAVDLATRQAVQSTQDDRYMGISFRTTTEEIVTAENGEITEQNIITNRHPLPLPDGTFYSTRKRAWCLACWVFDRFFNSFDRENGLECEAGHWFCKACGCEIEEGIAGKSYCRLHAYKLREEIESEMKTAFLKTVGNFFFGFIDDTDNQKYGEVEPSRRETENPNEPSEQADQEVISTKNPNAKGIGKGKGGNQQWTGKNPGHNTGSSRMIIPDYAKTQNPSYSTSQECNMGYEHQGYKMKKPNEYDSFLESLKRKPDGSW